MAKKHISLWLDEDVLKKIDANIKVSKLNNRSEYLEEAADFYNGYVHSRNNEKFVGKTFLKVMQSMLDNFEKRMARLLFKQAVETSKVFWLVARGFELDPKDADILHADCIREVKEINGAIRFPYKSKSEEDETEEEE